MPFVTTYLAAVSNVKQMLTEQWSLRQNQPLLKTIYLKPPIISCKRGKSLKDTLVKSKIKVTLMLSCEATNKTIRGARAGLSLTHLPGNVVCDGSAARNAGIH